MRILYYSWDEFNGEDCRDAMVRLGHQVDTIKIQMEGYDLTPEMEKAFEEKLTDGYDLVFSFDFFPNISEFCQKHNIPYISWVFDCPHYTLDSHITNNSANRIYLFDRKLYEQMLGKGINTIRYSPLAVNAERLSKLCHDLDAETGGNIVYQHDVCFLGSLYDNEYNFYDQVKYLPPYLKGYVDAVIAAQERVFGADFFTMESIFSDEHVRQLREFIKFEETGKYQINYDNVIRDILRKKVTVNERHHILEQMGRHFDTVLYTHHGARDIPRVCNMGVADYYTKMPKVFHRSKINLNITLRSILSGVPLRVIDILAAGGFLITNYQEEIAEYFVDGQDLVIAYTPEDMVEKTAYYLEHEDERKAIALNGQKKVLENFAYTNLLPTILTP
jgi:spore maturation protein CgeB